MDAEHDCDARTPKNPCDLCKRRAMCAGDFVAVEDGTFVCDSCIPIDEPIAARYFQDPEPDETLNLWEEGSGGWLSDNIKCRCCGRTIDVVTIDEEEAEES